MFAAAATKDESSIVFLCATEANLGMAVCNKRLKASIVSCIEESQHGIMERRAFQRPKNIEWPVRWS